MRVHPRPSVVKLPLMMSDFSKKKLAALLNPKQLFKHILALAVRVAEAESGALFLLNPNTGHLDVEAAVSDASRKRTFRLGEGIIGWVAGSGQAFRTGDARGERRYVEVDPRVRSMLTVPLDLSGQVIGVVSVSSARLDAFAAGHERSLSALARDASEWIRLAWEINQLRVKGDQLETLADIGQVIISEDRPENLLQDVAEQARRLMNARLCSLMLLSDNGEELILKAWAGASRAYVKKPNLQVNESLVGVVVRRQRPLAILDVQDHQRYQHTELARREQLVSLLSVPLVFQGKSLGVLSVYTGRMHRFSNAEIRLLTAMAGLSAVAIAKSKLLERVLQMEEDLRASERLSALGWLAAEIAHEIRNPLTVVQMLFHSMLAEMRLEGGLARDAALIETKMRQMNRILEQVLTFARSSEPSLEIIEAGDLIEDVALLIRHTVAERRIELRKHATPGLKMRGDRAQLEQAILNLVLNACQAMSGGGALTLSARSSSAGNKPVVSIEIKDTGEGMSKERQEELFQPFLSHKKGGTGLGLALVHKTVQSHQGEIKCRSRLKHGTAFRMMFPAA
ncbi:MAG: GAF domain-containing protein [Verrucomicrobiales bacterium]|jgi:signal transduction histidine kinase|nr:GAF domain-containing protein [Verrucomicrobiales bacterium]